MREAPDIIGGARVVVYSPIDHRHRPTGGCRHTVAGVVQGAAAGLAICRHDGEDACYLFGCDRDWNTITDTWHPAVRDAMRQAESEYEGVWRTWLGHGPGEEGGQTLMALSNAFPCEKGTKPKADFGAMPQFSLP